jgi:folate-dependent phosphoribosylglycinamide formyltransferase PurN
MVNQPMVLCIMTFYGNPIAADLFLELKQSHNVYIVYTDNLNLSFRAALQRKRGMRWFLFNQLFKKTAKLYNKEHIPKCSWSQLCREYPDKFIKVLSHNSQSFLQQIVNLKVDMGILIGTSIIKAQVFQTPRLGMINLHQGHVPNFRGAPPAYWEHQSGEKMMFVTVHIVVEALDAGGILCEDSFSIQDHPHPVVSKFQANMLSSKLLLEAVNRRLEESPTLKRKINRRCKTVPGYYLLLKEFYCLLLKIIHR